MSAIGEYIHLTAAGYEEFGINRPHTNAGISAAAAYSTQKQKLAQKVQQYNRVGPNTAKKIENELNQLIEKLGAEGTENSEVGDIDAYITEQIGQEMSQLSSINWNNLTTVSAPAPISKMSTGFYNFKNWKEKITSRVSEFNAMLKQLELVQSSTGRRCR